MTTCPKCGGIYVRRSHHRWYDRVLQLFSLNPYRCRHCMARFYRSDEEKAKVNGTSH